MNLRTKFNSVLILISIISLAVIHFLASSSLEEAMKQQMLDKAQIILSLAENINNPNALDQTAATSDIRYKNVILTAQNFSDEASIWQSEVVEHIQNHPEISNYNGFKSDEKGQFFFLAQSELSNGKLNAVKIVSIYQRVYQDVIQKQLNNFFLFLILIALVIIVILNILFHFVILKPIQQMVQQSLAISKGKSDQNEMIISASTELNTIADSFNRMQRSLKAAMLMLNK